MTSPDDELSPSAWSPRIARVTEDVTDLDPLLRRLKLGAHWPVVVLVGGASGLGPEASARCDTLLRRAVIPAMERAEAVLVDGGTDSGIIALAGRARRDAGALGPQIGVVAEGTVDLAGGLTTRPGLPAGDRVRLEPHHTLVLVVPGQDWGDEAPWLSALATAMAGAAPSVTVLANGGDVAYDDVRHSLAAGRPVLALAGTGRTADEIAAACAGSPADPRAVEVAESALVSAVGPGSDAVAAALDAALRRPPG